MSLSDYADRADALWRDTYSRTIANMAGDGFNTHASAVRAKEAADRAVADYAKHCATTKPDAVMPRLLGEVKP